MANYTNWVIGGLIPLWVLNDPKIDRKNRTITLNCFANRDLMNGADPEDEVQRFTALTSQVIINTTNNVGGSCLRVNNTGTIFSVTNGTETWEKCALQPISTNYDEYYPLAGLFFTLVIEFEVQIGGGFVVFEPDYHDYENLEYYGGTDKTQIPYNSDGNEFGYIKATLDNKVKKVTIYGSGCILPAWVKVDGAKEGKQYWTYSHEGHEEEVFAGRGVQTMTFNLAVPTKEIVMYTSTHVMPYDDAHNHGCWAIRIRMDFA